MQSTTPGNPTEFTKSRSILQVGRTKVLLCIISIITFSGLDSNAQQFYLFHFSPGSNCSPYKDIYNLFFGIDNKIVVRSAFNNPKDLNSISIESDSIRIQKINDSLYYFRSFYKNVRCKIYITNLVSGKKVDSAQSYCIDPPFEFSINTGQYDLHYTRIIIESMKHLVLKRIASCTTYEREFSIIKYTLVLKRNDTILTRADFKGRQMISKSFKNKLIQLYKEGDGLFAQDIVVKGKDRRKISINEYGLLRIN